MIHYLSKANSHQLRGTVLLRLDFNTEDDWRMRAALPTIKFLLKNGCKIVVLSHRGRPPVFAKIAKSRIPHLFIQTNEQMKKFSLKGDAPHLARLLKRRVIFVDHFDFAQIKKTITASPAGSVFLLENLRFIAGEEKNDSTFAQAIALLGDFYVDDAFAVSHRANASVAAITGFLPSYAGFELEAEIVHLSQIMTKLKLPLVMIVGGAKVSDKLGVLRYFRTTADRFLLGGGPANTLLAARGMNVRKSLKDNSNRAAVKKIAGYSNVILPIDYIWRKNAIVDIGPATISLFAEKIKGAQTIVWSGPLGLIDKKPYREGSLHIARAIVKNRKAISVAGGGETVMFLKRIYLDKKFTFISTGGGAMLDFLAGKKLPGIEALK